MRQSRRGASNPGCSRLSRRPAQALLRLYPKTWRNRYGEELAALMADAPQSWQMTWDVLKGALKMQLKSHRASRILLACLAAGTLLGWISSLAVAPKWEAETVILIAPEDSSVDLNLATQKLMRLAPSSPGLRSVPSPRPTANSRKIVIAARDSNPGDAAQTTSSTGQEAIRAAFRQAQTDPSHCRVRIVINTEAPRKPVFRNALLFVAMGSLNRRITLGGPGAQPA
jgi:hypothetical protein